MSTGQRRQYEYATASDKYLNRDFKTELRSANRCTTASSLRAQATAFMEFLATMPERVKSYFNHGPVVFAACSG